MVRQTSGAGPFRFRLGSIDVGESETVNTRQSLGGPRDKRGGLTKFYGDRGGFDFAVVTNNSDEVIEATADGGVRQDVPAATSVVISGVGPDGSPEPESTVYTVVTVENTGFITSATIDANLISVAFGNQARPEESNGGSGGVGIDITDAIPGVVRNGR